ERDPNRPRSMWWLTDGTFVGFRMVCFADAPRKDQDAAGAKLEIGPLKTAEGGIGSVRVTGTVKNTGDKPLDEIELTVYYLDDAGKPYVEDNKFRPTFTK